MPIQALALWALWKAFPIMSETLLPSIEKKPPSPRKGFDSNLLFLPAMIAWYISYIFFDMWWWFAGLVAVILTILSVYYFLKRSSHPPTAPDFTHEKAALVLLLALSVILRFPFLNRSFTGLQADEAFNLINAINTLQGMLGTPFGSYYSWPFLPTFLLAMPFKLFGVELAVARGFSALISLISVYYFYRWCRINFGVAASWLASAFFSYCWWNLFYSLSVFSHIFTVFFEILAFLYLAKALKEGGKPYFIWAGFFLALSSMTHYSGRLVPIIAAMSLSVYCLVDTKKNLKAYGRHFLLSCLSFLWLAGPFLVFLARNPNEIYGRAEELITLRSGHGLAAYVRVLERIATTFYSFFWPNHFCVDLRFGLASVPALDPFLGIFCFLGLILALIRYRRWENLVALSGLVFGILATAMSINVDPPSTTALFISKSRPLFLRSSVSLLPNGPGPGMGPGVFRNQNEAFSHGDDIPLGGHGSLCYPSRTTPTPTFSNSETAMKIGYLWVSTTYRLPKRCRTFTPKITLSLRISIVIASWRGT